MEPFLTLPSVQRRDSFEQALRECTTREEMREFGYEFSNLETILEYWVDRYISELDSYTRGEKLPVWWVAQSTYWLIVEDEFIWQIKRRHELTDNLTTYGWHLWYVIRPSKRQQWWGTKILTLALDLRKEEWFKQFLITCNEKNIWSRKIIEANGGVYDNKIRSHEEEDMKLRYWLYL